MLEHGYLTEVERRHGLPRGAVRRATGIGARTIYRDVEYASLGVIFELDGRLFHTSTRARDRDMDRDLDAAVAGHGDDPAVLRPGLRPPLLHGAQDRGGAAPATVGGVGSAPATAAPLSSERGSFEE